MVSVFRAPPVIRMKYWWNLYLLITDLIIGRAETRSYESLFTQWCRRRIGCCRSYPGNSISARWRIQTITTAKASVTNCKQALGMHLRIFRKLSYRVWHTMRRKLSVMAHLVLSLKQQLQRQVKQWQSKRFSKISAIRTVNLRFLKLSITLIAWRCVSSSILMEKSQMRFTLML